MLDKISRHHFKIVKSDIKDDTPIYIYDLSGEKLLFVNNEKLHDRKRILVHGDKIQLLPNCPGAFVFHSFCMTYRSFPREITSSYFISTILGEGACGIVRKIIDIRKCAPYAVKTLSIEAELKNKERKNDQMKTEKEILLTLNHPNILSIIKHYSFDNKEFLILEYMAGGDLLRRIHDWKGLKEKYCKIYFYQLVLAVEYLHKSRMYLLYFFAC